MKNDSRVVTHHNLASDITASLEYAGHPYLSKGQLKNLKVVLAATTTSHSVPFNGRLHHQFETVFKCLLEVADQQAEAKKPPKMQVIGRNVGSSSARTTTTMTAWQNLLRQRVEEEVRGARPCLCGG